MAEQKKQDTNQLLKVRREKLTEFTGKQERIPFQITKFDNVTSFTCSDVKELYECS